MATIDSTDLSPLVARSGAARSGAFRCGFAPKNTSKVNDTPSGPFYHWDEFVQDADGTSWTTVRE